MFEPRIRISKQLHERLEKIAEKKGYSSTDEFILHVLDHAANDAELETSEEEVRKRLKGLGYL